MLEAQSKEIRGLRREMRELREGHGTATEKLHLLANLQRALSKAGMLAEDQAAAFARIGDIGALVEADSSLTQQLARSPAPLLQKVDDATNSEPDLAESMPEVSSDGCTVTLKIKQGIKFSPPVNREVEAKDVKYAIERGFFNQS